MVTGACPQRIIQTECLANNRITYNNTNSCILHGMCDILLIIICTACGKALRFTCKLYCSINTSIIMSDWHAQL